MGTIVIAHRLSTIRNADEINVIVGGKVVEHGTHDDLMAKESYYKRLVNKQEEGAKTGSNPSSRGPSRSNSLTDLTKMDKLSDGTPHIAFRDVTFAYPTRPKKTILNKFNLVVEQGQTVALVGPSGQGKSTTVGLIERFYDPSEGSIEYLGQNVKDLNVAWYRDQIGYVGQEPTLFNDTITNNVAYGAPGATQEEIQQASKQANAHDFITGFAEGYDTPLGEKTALSGGQKQRIAIARALVKKPKVLLLDEATSALDNESESLVQEAIDNLISSGEHTVIMIAHRLSTIRGADGIVVEIGSHEDLIKKENGRYQRLYESSKRQASVLTTGLSPNKMSTVDEDEEAEGKLDWAAEEAKLPEEAFSYSRAVKMASPDLLYICLGTIGAVASGGVFPMWGVLFSETIDLLFTRVLPCDEATADIPGGFDNCEDYWEDSAEEMRESSFKIAIYWGIVLVGCLCGFTLMFWGFGMASERLNKRTRDAAFHSLMRQEVAFFDVVTGVVLSFIFMWPFALLAIGCVPLMGFATSIEMKQFLGEDEGTDSADELNSPGGIIVETLLNMRTVSALTMEEKRYADYENAIVKSEPNYKWDS